MSDLISRQSLLNNLERYRELFSWDDGDRERAMLSRVIKELQSMPSAQPEIIRCKDCRHYQFADNRAFGMPVKMCEWFGFEDVDDDDFCSRAERVNNELV